MDIKMKKQDYSKTSGKDWMGNSLKKGDKVFVVHFNNPNGKNSTKIISRSPNASRGSRDFITLNKRHIVE